MKITLLNHLPHPFRWLALVGALALAPPSAQAQTAAAVNGAGGASSKAVDDLSGYYEIEGKKPAALANFEWLQLEQKTPGKSAALTGYVRLMDRRKAEEPYWDLRFEQVTRDETRLSFRTEERGGERYEFAGDLLKTGNFAALFGDDLVVVLEGHLKKLRNGRVESDSEVKFHFFIGD
ncbi:MAG TPA: hypothetical protein VHG32_04365 [Thermoanaerobaculia bacterium]|nr:hypothetical protein [Thermoanaerobaculia bacterium]